MKNILPLLLLVVVIGACKKKPDPLTPEVPVTKNTNGELRISISHMAGNQALQAGKGWYKTENGDSLQIDRLLYFLSNFKLVKADGSMYIEPESYYLVQHKNDTDFTIVIEDVPPGQYSKLVFLLGVDSARNTSGAQTGALDPNSGMFWDWNTGYIMARLEGKSPQSANHGSVIYHLGGYKGFYSVLREISLDAAMKIEVEKPVNMHIKADALEWFKTPNKIDIAKTSVMMSAGANAAKLADNCTDMFKIDHID